ncbi:MAG: hypothetical protein JNL81_07945 [Hyphomonadaceae bacterium]|nr:hypothetical protein [Hyphomonadaceae bacterium]
MSKGTFLTRRSALLGGAVAAGLATPATAQSLGDILRQSLQAPQTTPTQQQQAPPAVPAVTGRQELAPLGYALQFQGVRSLIDSGNFSGARQLFEAGPAPAATTEASAGGEQASRPARLFSTSDVFLTNCEMGLMGFDGATFDSATTNFAAAHESVLGDRAQQTGTRWDRLRQTVSRSLRRGAAFVSGRDEIAVYRQRDYERILQLNYLSLSYLVPGDRRAYNVNRLAIEEQDLARREFEEEIAEAQTRLGTARNEGATGAEAARATDAFSQEFEAYSGVAGRVPSAYVNPIGFYISGVTQEITSVERPALRGNARNSYQAALDLIGRSPQLTSAVTAMQAPPVPGQRVVHMIIGEGFAPSRQALLYGVPVAQQVVPVRIPIFVPNNSSINRIDVVNSRNQLIGRLDPMGDIEGMVMRSQQDRMPQILIGVIASAWRSSQEQRFAAGMGEIASRVMQYKQSFDSPDMRSWSSLPARFFVGRIVLPAGAQPIRINAYAGTQLRHSQTITPPGPDLQHSVIYGRTTDSVLSIEQPRRLWIDGIDEDVAQ